MAQRPGTAVEHISNPVTDVFANLDTPDPLFTSESIATTIGTIIALAVVLFKLNISGAIQAELTTALVSLWGIYTALHAKGIRAARALAAGIAAGSGSQVAVKP